MQHTNHSERRANQRGISNEKIEIAIEYGTCFHKQGLLFYVLGDKDVPRQFLRNKEKYSNIVVVMAGDSDKLITCYRNNNAYKNIRQKTKQFNTNKEYSA